MDHPTEISDNVQIVSFWNFDQLIWSLPTHLKYNLFDCLHIFRLTRGTFFMKW